QSGAAVPLEVAGTADPHRRTARGSGSGAGGCLLRLAPSGFAPWLGGFGPVASARRSRDLYRARRSAARTVSRRRRAAAAALDRLSPVAAAHRVLDQPRAPAARAPPVRA